MYLVGNVWNGGLSISPLRVFEVEADAIAYAIEWTKEKYSDVRWQEAADRWMRVYEVYPDKPPRRIKFKV